MVCQRWPALAVAQEADDLLDEAALPQERPGAAVPRSATGNEVTTAQPPHAVASRRASFEIVPGQRSGDEQLGRRVVSAADSGFIQESRGERQTRPAKLDGRGLLECGDRRVARRDEKSASGRRRKSGQMSQQIGQLRSGSQGSSDSPCPGRSMATVSISSWRAISTGKVPGIEVDAGLMQQERDIRSVAPAKSAQH